jgi:hypothetical protein
VTTPDVDAIAKPANTYQRSTEFARILSHQRLELCLAELAGVARAHRASDIHRGDRLHRAQLTDRPDHCENLTDLLLGKAHPIPVSADEAPGMVIDDSRGTIGRLHSTASCDDGNLAIAIAWIPRSIDHRPMIDTPGTVIDPNGKAHWRRCKGSKTTG